MMTRYYADFQYWDKGDFQKGVDIATKDRDKKIKITFQDVDDIIDNFPLRKSFKSVIHADSYDEAGEKAFEMAGITEFDLESSMVLYEMPFRTLQDVLDCKEFVRTDWNDIYFCEDFFPEMDSYYVQDAAMMVATDKQEGICIEYLLYKYVGFTGHVSMGVFSFNGKPFCVFQAAGEDNKEHWITDSDLCKEAIAWVATYSFKNKENEVTDLNEEIPSLSHFYENIESPRLKAK